MCQLACGAAPRICRFGARNEGQGIFGPLHQEDPMRKAILVLALLSLLVSCRHGYYDHTRVPNQCSKTVDVCIDPSTLVASPNPVHIQRGDWAHFAFSGGTDDLKIESDVLEDIESCGGQAWGRARKDALPGSEHKYSIVDLTTRRVNDPTIIIDP
jgi:hypothetical protein